MSNRDPYKVECGQRLRQTRLALNALTPSAKYNVARQFAYDTGISESNLNNWEGGVSLVPPRYVEKLKQLFGVTHDWIYGNDAAGLRHDLAVKLLEAQLSQET